ncbi:hypothetical protein K0504_09615 [Neiella marina]|uniref:PD-(D/E)XK endonuclease-like domain-containing protein n=1 Tax=Neiella holothuriorum TaxID=2870530 RepID=A0ABS7EG65_9GAMM|nr:hypothetical protein [Neiella holothuriorum]MBW8191293.1 hypothetical protein [Neiella holothuriorum]
MIDIAIVVLVIVVFITVRNWRIKRLFNAPLLSILIGADIGKHKKAAYIAKKGICGAPDALFFDLLRLRFFVGEFKSRRYSGSVSHRERYQVLLYTGLVRRWYWPRSIGVIAYGCGHVESVKFDATTYRKLLQLKPEVSQSMRHWKAVDNRPLHQRH